MSLGTRDYSSLRSPSFGQGQRGDLDAGQGAAQQIGRLADTALEPILDLDLGWLR